MVKPWEQQGCPACRHAAGIGMSRPLALTDNDDEMTQFARLWRCETCQAFWVEEQRYACEISDADARARFPTAFALPNS